MCGSRTKEMADRILCPSCGSSEVAKIMWGEPAFTEELVEQLESGAVVLGGCCLSESSPEWQCRSCGHRFGNAWDSMFADGSLL